MVLQLPVVHVPDEALDLSWSQVKTWQRCQRQWKYKYIDRLEPIARQRALFLGNWVHRCLETYYSEGDWKTGHLEYVEQWDKLFEEEQKALSTRSKKAKTYTPLPKQVARIINSYLWYHKNDGWKVISVELEFTVHLKDDIYINGKIDLIVQDEEGLYWVVDHKTASNIPESGAFHAMDPQLMIYPWAVKKLTGIDIAGIIYNYVKSKPPSIPKINKNGSLSKRKIVTDYPTAARFLKKEGYDLADFSEFLLPLKKKSEFLRRYRLPRESFVTKEILAEFYSSAKEIKTKRIAYEAGAKVRFIRNITKDCSKFCAFHNICQAELNGHDTEYTRKKLFTLRHNKEADGNDITGELEEADES